MTEMEAIESYISLLEKRSRTFEEENTKLRGLVKFLWLKAVRKERLNFAERIYVSDAMEELGISPLGKGDE